MAVTVEAQVVGGRAGGPRRGVQAVTGQAARVDGGLLQRFPAGGFDGVSPVPSDRVEPRTTVGPGRFEDQEICPESGGRGEVREGVEPGRRSAGSPVNEEVTEMSGIKVTKRLTQPRPRPPLDLRTPSGRPLPY
ncbi:hypothetical protein [Kitasatospora cinereorecta]|uniref:Uncharacterized protein n=1 Tax=Kitasatospora cinereorecta TaxID=285560 RepID=A0ABW0V929_9ACTN